MEQTRRRIFLIQSLLKEQPQYKRIRIPEDENGQKQLLRSLLNVRRPRSVSGGFLTVQDEYLREETAGKGITDLAGLSPIADGIYLWKGDITTLRCDAIVNAANSGMTGCYIPCHNCIDNCIHTYAGVQLRLACAELMAKQGREEAVGLAKVTPAYNLPCKYVIHTVGPMITGDLTGRDCGLLASCYRSCLEAASQNDVKSVAFCCISTGVFHFPNDRAAEIAVRTVKAFRRQTGGDMEVVFNVFKDDDAEIYKRLLEER